MQKLIRIVILALALLVPMASYSQYIINDKDGWTNIRKEPNAKAKVVGKVYKHQVFLPLSECDDSYDENFPYPSSYDYDVDKWLAIDYVSSKKHLKGYIFKDNIINIVEEFPAIEKDVSHDEKKDITTTTAKKGNVTVIMETRPNENVRFGTETKLTVIISGKKTTIPADYDFSLYAGHDGALYLALHSRDIIDERSVSWFSIVNGKITSHGGWYTGVC